MISQPRPLRFLLLAALAAWQPLVCATMAVAHPLIENALDVVVSPQQIVVDARISNEEVLLLAGHDDFAPTEEEYQHQIKTHGEYVLAHVHVHVDGHAVAGQAVYVADAATNSADADPANDDIFRYRLTFAVSSPPRKVQVEQDFLREFKLWNAPCELRIRCIDQKTFKSSLLKRGDVGELTCDWTAGARPVAAGSIQTEVNGWQTFLEYAGHGIEHILTGYDHLLFVTALVLAATRLWDLVKVVTAFTLAHSLTLTLSVLNIVTLSDRIVEPMIAASIVFVAVQNIFWPERNTGWARLAVAFGFGLFHGLGFAGGLKDAMSEMPSIALWLALVGFSLGVETGHQIVVLPLFSALQVTKRLGAPEPRVWLMDRILRVGSAGIALGGIYYLFQAL